MEQQINDLKDQLARAHEPREESGDIEKVELEVRLQNAEARAQAAQRQLEEQALSHAREVQMLKQQLLSKESLIDTMQRGQQQNAPNGGYY